MMKNPTGSYLFEFLKLTTMKYLLTFLFLLSLSIIVSGQEHFKLWLDNSNDEYPRDPVQLADGGFIMPVVSRITFYDFFSQKILHISPQGNILKEKIIINPEGDCHIHNLIYVNDSTLIGIGEWKLNGQNSKLWYLCFDTDLNIRWEKKYETSNDWFIWLRSFIDSDNNVVSCITLAPYVNPGLAEIYFMKTNLEGDSLTSRYELLGNSPQLFDIFESDSTYLGFVKGFSPYTWGQVLTIDKEFNILAMDSIPKQIHTGVTVKSNSNTSYYLTGNTSFGGTSQDIMITLLNKDNDCISFSRIGRSADTIDMGGADISMDYITKTNILVGGSSNLDPGHIYYSSTVSWYSLSSFDSLLNLKWTKYYGGDVYYVLRSIVATADGGALLSGTRYDYLTPDNKLDVYILKVDSAGLYTSIGENPGIQVLSAIVYPNPAHEALNVQTELRNARIAIYDINGKEILTQELQQGISNIEIQHLAIGIYFYRITSHGNFIESGKWMKE